MTSLPTETREGFAPWHPDRGFYFHGINETYGQADEAFGSQMTRGWRIVPVTITLTATGMGATRKEEP